MNRKKSFEINESLLNKIISVAYRDADLFDKLQVESLSKKHSEVKDLLNEYKKTADDVEKIKEEKCPDELLVLIKDKTIDVKENSKTFISDFFSVIFRSPVVSTALVIIVVGAVLFGVFLKDQQEYKYSIKEIELADKQTKQALAIVGKIFNETNTTLKEEVFKSRVTKPIRESMDVVNELFAPADKYKNGGIQ
jgi:hypothetical protein